MCLKVKHRGIHGRGALDWLKKYTSVSIEPPEGETVEQWIVF